MQPIYLLDTNIISEMTKEKPNLQVLKRISDNKRISSIASVAFEDIREVSSLMIENWFEE